MLSLPPKLIVIVLASRQGVRGTAGFATGALEAIGRSSYKCMIKLNEMMLDEIAYSVLYYLIEG